MTEKDLFYKEEYFDNTSEMLKFINETMEGKLITILPIITTNRFIVIYAIDAYKKSVFEFISGMAWHISGTTLYIKKGCTEKLFKFTPDNYKQLLHDLKDVI